MKFRLELPKQQSGQATAELPPAPGQALKPNVSTVENNTQVVRGARARVVTDVMDVEIDANGGDLRQMTLSHYRQNEQADQPFVLLEESAGRNYFAQMGFVGGSLPTHKTVFELVPGEYRLKDGQNVLQVTLKANLNGAELVRSYTFHRGSYSVDIDTRIINCTAALLEGFPYYQLLRNGKAPEGESMPMHTYTGPAIYTDTAKFQKVSFEDIAKGKTDYVKEAKDGWIALVQHHFVSAWFTRDPADASQREFYTRAIGNDEFTSGFIFPQVKLNPGERKKQSR